MAKAQKPTKKVKAYRAGRRYGILNHVGEIWSPETFGKQEEAQGYLDAQQKANPSWTLGRHKVIPVRLTISFVAHQ